MRINLVGCEKDGVLITHDERWFCEQCRLPDDLHARLLAAEKLASALEAIQFGWNQRCPACAGWNCGANGETDNEHTKECSVAAALSAWKDANK